jgi:hypothetical protein
MRVPPSQSRPHPPRADVHIDPDVCTHGKQSAEPLTVGARQVGDGTHEGGVGLRASESGAI